MPKIPSISYAKAIKAFQKLGYRAVRQRGSHIRLYNFINKSQKPLTIPRHKIISKGLMRKLLRDAEISRDEFLQLLK